MRKKNMTYKFVSNFDVSEEQNDPNRSISTYYQLCMFENPRNKRHHIRRFEINKNNEIMDVKQKWLTNQEYNNFVNKVKCHEYKLYNTYDLSNVEFPSMNDIISSKSDLLNYSNNYTGFALF